MKQPAAVPLPRPFGGNPQLINLTVGARPAVGVGRGPGRGEPGHLRRARPSTAASTRCLLVGGLVIASRQRSRQTCSASSLVSSASRSGGTIPAKLRRHDATWRRARLAASPARAGHETSDNVRAHSGPAYRA